jgi:3-deoxy-manno-octulosonate cytidylyltransferase (CMP-KDO synthetase)
MTDPDLPSGSDRVFQAVERFDPDRKHGVVVNLQGDLPALDPAQVRAVADVLAVTAADIATLAAEIEDPADCDNPSVVKPVVAWDVTGDRGRALYFTRSRAPANEGPLYHHIGIYAYTRDALSRFVKLPPSALERREKLEQLRALEANMSIAIARVDSVPISVDTPADLEKARSVIAASRK